MPADDLLSLAYETNSAGGTTVSAQEKRISGNHKMPPADELRVLEARREAELRRLSDKLRDARGRKADFGSAYKERRQVKLFLYIDKGNIPATSGTAEPSEINGTSGTNNMPPADELRYLEARREAELRRLSDKLASAREASRARLVFENDSRFDINRRVSTDQTRTNRPLNQTNPEAGPSP